MLQFTAWCFRLVQKLQSQLVVGSRNRYNGWSSASDKFSRVHQLITSTQFPSVGTVIGLCLAQQSYLPCMIFWEVLIFQHSLFFPKSNHKDITTRNNKYLFIYLFIIYIDQAETVMHTLRLMRLVCWTNVVHSVKHQPMLCWILPSKAHLWADAPLSQLWMQIGGWIACVSLSPRSVLGWKRNAVTWRRSWLTGNFIDRTGSCELKETMVW